MNPAWVAKMKRGAGVVTFSRFPVVANLREHWGKKCRRTKLHRGIGRMIGSVLKRTTTLPATLLITRYSAQLADEDNLRSAFKGAVDGLADAFGVKDDPASKLQFSYSQEKCPRGCYGCRVSVIPHCPGCTDPRSEGTHCEGTIEHPTKSKEAQP